MRALLLLRSPTLALPAFIFIGAFALGSWRLGLWQRTVSAPADRGAPGLQHRHSTPPAPTAMTTPQPLEHIGQSSAPADVVKPAPTEPAQVDSGTSDPDSAEDAPHPLPIRLGRVQGRETDLTLRNTSAEPLHLTLTANAGSARASTLELDVAPRTTVELRSAGLQLGPDDSLTVASTQYDARTWRGL